MDGLSTCTMVTLLLIWIVIITSFSLFGSWYARKYNKPDALIALYTAFLILSQIIAVKIAGLDIGFTMIFVPAATIIFAVTFLLTDIVNEKFGRFEVYKMILIAFIAQVMMVVFIWIATRMTPAPF